jgi:hypothetical protein
MLKVECCWRKQRSPRHAAVLHGLGELQHQPQRATPAPSRHTTMGHGAVICWTAYRSLLSPVSRSTTTTTTLSARAS